MTIEILARRSASMLLISGALAAAIIAPARAGDKPCATGAAATQAQMTGPSTAQDNRKPVDDGFGRKVDPVYGTTAPGTPSQLADEKKKGDKTADAASDPTCK